MENNQIKLMLVEDHDSVRKAFCFTLKDLFDFNVVCDAANGKEALTLLNTFKPHIILMDVEMPEMSGFETLKIIKEQYSGIKVIMFTAYEGYLLNSESLLRGADAVISKSFSLDELVLTIRMVASKESHVESPRKSVSFDDGTTLTRKNRTASDEPLTTRESEVLQLICKNNSNKDIATMLHMSIRTVESHRRSIYQKLGANSIIDLFKYAIKHKLTTFYC